MMTDYMFGTGLDEVVKGQAKHNKTYVYNFNYYSWNDYLPPWRGIYNKVLVANFINFIIICVLKGTAKLE